MKSFLVMKGVYDGNMSEYHSYVDDLNGGHEKRSADLEKEQEFLHEAMLLEMEAQEKPEYLDFQIQTELIERRQQRLKKEEESAEL